MCEKGYPDRYKGKLCGYSLGAAPPGRCRELVLCTGRKHSELTRDLIGTQELRRHHPASSDLAEAAFEGDRAC